MPQKKNFTIFERLRGETAHLISLHFDFFLGQRNTPYTNLVEVSKKAGRYLILIFQHMERITLLLTLVLEHLEFLVDDMRKACEQEFHAGFALANLLTTRDRIPYRKTQIIAGKYLGRAMKHQLTPSQLSIAELKVEVSNYGYSMSISQSQLQEIFDADASLRSKRFRHRNRNMLTWRHASLKEKRQLSLLWGHCISHLYEVKNKIKALPQLEDRRMFHLLNG